MSILMIMPMVLLIAKNLIFKCNDKCGALIWLAFYFNMAAETGDVIMNQIQTNTLAVVVMMKLLIKSKDAVFYLFHVKALAVIGIYQLPASVFKPR